MEQPSGDGAAGECSIRGRVIGHRGPSRHALYRADLAALRARYPGVGSSLLMARIILAQFHLARLPADHRNGALGVLARPGQRNLRRRMSPRERCMQPYRIAGGNSQPFLGRSQAPRVFCDVPMVDVSSSSRSALRATMSSAVCKRRRPPVNRVPALQG